MVKDLIHKVYFSEEKLTERDYRISRNLFIFEGSTAQGILTLSSGAFLAGFASLLGADDQFNGIIAAIPTLAAVIQVISPMVFEKLERRKFLVSIMCLFFRLVLGTMVFIPIFVQGTAARLGLITAFYLTAYLACSFISPPAGNWIVSLTPENIRGAYLGRRDTFMMLFVTIISLTMGRVLDIYRAQGLEFNGFIIVYCVVLVMAFMNFGFLSATKEPVVRKSCLNLNLKSVLSIPLQDKKFRRIIVMFVLWNMGLQVGGPFVAVYMVTGLKLDYTYIMIMSMIATAVRVLLSIFWGRLADRTSWVVTSKLSVGLLAVGHFLWALVNPTTAHFMIPLLHVLTGAAWAGIGISLFSIPFMFAPEEGRTVYLGFNAALGGLTGFLSTLFGSFLIGVLVNKSAAIGGLAIGSMQVVFAISGIILGLCATFTHYFVRTGEA